MNRTELKILLLQIRDQSRVRIEEYESFISYSGLAPYQIDILNAFDTPAFDSSILNGYDALFVGGASEASVLEPDKYPFVESGIQLLQFCIEHRIPVFASCFGFQLAVLALGGDIIRDKKNYEMGTIPIQLSETAKEATKGPLDG